MLLVSEALKSWLCLLCIKSQLLLFTVSVYLQSLCLLYKKKKYPLQANMDTQPM